MNAGPPEMTWVQVASSDAIPEGEARSFSVDGTRVAVARAQGQLHAVEDVCSHDDGPLGAGCLDGFAIQCPRHGAKFDIRTGAVLSMPAVVGIRTLEVKEDGGVVFVGVLAGDSDPSAVGDDW